MTPSLVPFYKWCPSLLNFFSFPALASHFLSLCIEMCFFEHNANALFLLIACSSLNSHFGYYLLVDKRQGFLLHSYILNVPVGSTSFYFLPLCFLRNIEVSNDTTPSPALYSQCLAHGQCSEY